MTTISQEEFITIVAGKDNKLREVMHTIGQIDKDHNGYVTKNELDDILKLFYREKLAKKILIPFVNKFSSISNKILIDYNSFIKWVQAEFKALEMAKVNKKQFEK